MKASCHFVIRSCLHTGLKVSVLAMGVSFHPRLYYWPVPQAVNIQARIKTEQQTRGLGLPQGMAKQSLEDTCTHVAEEGYEGPLF